MSAVTIVPGADALTLGGGSGSGGGALNPQELNRYSYVNNNPVKNTDPTGHWLESAIDIASIAYDVYDISQNGLTVTSGLALAADVVSLALPVVAGGGMAVRAIAHADDVVDVVAHADDVIDAGRAAENVVEASVHAPHLPDDALVCRGGTCTADRFANGSGVALDANGKLDNVSVNSAPGKTIGELTTTIPNKQVGVTTVGEIRSAGGDVIPDPTVRNPYHCKMCGVTPRQAEDLFTPTVKNPNVR